MEYGYVAGWIGWLVLLSLLGWPLTARLFPDWPTRGLGFTLPVVLLTLGVVTFWVGRLTFGPLALLVGLLVVVGLVAAVGFDRVPGSDGSDTAGDASGADGRATDSDTTGDSVTANGWRARLARVRDQFGVGSVDRWAVGETAAVFFGAFAFLIAVRAADPAIFPYSGEKFLDYGLVQSLLRADSLPPADVWFAGETVQYYYGGHLLTALLSMLTATPAAFTYNLALAMFFAMYVTAAFDLAGAIAVARGYARRPAAWAAAFFVAVGANLQTAGVVLLKNGPAWLRTWVLNALPESIAAQVADRLGREFGYWGASRVIPGTINEFPLFAFLNGDLHAHMTDTPTLLLAAAVAFAIASTDDTRRRRLLVVGVVPVIGGFQAVVNTWSFPTVFGLAWLALALGDAPPHRLLPAPIRSRLDGPTAVTDGGTNGSDDGTNSADDEPADSDNEATGGSSSGDDDSTDASAESNGATPDDTSDLPGGRPPGASAPATSAGLAGELTRPVVAAGVVAFAGLIAAVLASPFLLTAAGSGSEREIALLGPHVTPTETVGQFLTRSSYGGLLVVHGGFLALFGAYLFDRLGGSRLVELLAALVVLGVVAEWLTLPALLLAGGVILLGWIAVRSRRAGFGTVLAVAGAGLVLLVEIVYLEEQAGPGRFNTVFKTYAQVWALWAPAAGVAVAGLLRRVQTPAVWPSTNLRRGAAVLLVVLVVASSGAYASKAVPQHFTAGGDSPGSAYSFGYPDEPTLNGTAYVEEFHPDTAPVIRYLERQPGQPTILTAPSTGRYPGDRPPNGVPVGMYGVARGGGGPAFVWASNPASSLTGVTTLAGWQHEVGYRGADAYYTRVGEVDRAFTNRSAAVETLRAHDVSYVLVGVAERSRYAGALIDFAAIPGVEPVVQSGDVVLYRVDHSELPGSSG